MNKTEEIQKLMEIRDNFPVDSYSKEVFADIIPQMANAIRNDMVWDGWSMLLSMQAEERAKLEQLKKEVTDLKKLKQDIKRDALYIYRQLEEMKKLQEPYSAITRAVMDCDRTIKKMEDLLK